MFDIAQRANLSGSTVKELTTTFRNLPPNAIVCCCGADTMYLHVELDGSAICLDVEDLEECYSFVSTGQPATQAQPHCGKQWLEKIRALVNRRKSWWWQRFAICCKKAVHTWEKTPTGYRAFILAERQRNSHRAAQFFQDELGKARQESVSLRQQIQDMRRAFAEALEKSNDQLRKEVRFKVQEAESGPRWEVVTEHCCLGGCDMGVYTFSQERDALLFAALLSAIDYKPPHNIACPACYAVYGPCTDDYE